MSRFSVAWGAGVPIVMVPRRPWRCLCRASGSPRSARRGGVVRGPNGGGPVSGRPVRRRGSRGGTGRTRRPLGLGCAPSHCLSRAGAGSNACTAPVPIACWPRCPTCGSALGGALAGHTATGAAGAATCPTRSARRPWRHRRMPGMRGVGSRRRRPRPGTPREETPRERGRPRDFHPLERGGSRLEPHAVSRDPKLRL